MKNKITEIKKLNLFQTIFQGIWTWLWLLRLTEGLYTFINHNLTSHIWHLLVLVDLVEEKTYPLGIRVGCVRHTFWKGWRSTPITVTPHRYKEDQVGTLHTYLQRSAVKIYSLVTTYGLAEINLCFLQKMADRFHKVYLVNHWNQVQSQNTQFSKKSTRMHFVH